MLVKLVSALAAFGVLGAIGAYYVPGILDRLGGAVTDRVPLDVDTFLSDAATPNYVFPDGVDPASAPGGDNVAAFAQWADQHGGVIADEQKIRLVIRGRTEEVVHINDIRIRVLEHRAPRSGWFNTWMGCGAAVIPTEIIVNVDKGMQTDWYRNGEPVKRPAFTVTSSDEETFDLTVQSVNEEISWVAEVEYSSAERDGVLRVDNDGKPFVLTTVGEASAYTLDPDRKAWLRTPDSDPGKAGSVRPPC